MVMVMVMVMEHLGTREPSHPGCSSWSPWPTSPWLALGLEAAWIIFLISYFATFLLVLVAELWPDWFGDRSPPFLAAASESSWSSSQSSQFGFGIWFLKIYADGPLQKVFLSISTDIHDGQFQGREWKSSWCTSYGQVIWTDIHAGYNWGPKKSQNKHRTNYGQIQYLIPILGYPLQIINFDWHMYWIKLGSNPIPVPKWSI